MFGRSGQMFPRRAFHDAIYEEEYGSESDEECCRGRGFSAVLCWFLSVIILIGLAASVVLTVFFILKSRSFLSKNNGDLDVLYEGDQGNGLVYPPSTDLNFDVPPGSRRSEEEDDEEPYSTSSTTARPNTARFTTRKPQNTQNSNERKPQPTKEPSLFNIFLDGMKNYENGDFPLTPSKESFVNFPNPASEEIISNESHDQRTRTRTPNNSNSKETLADSEEESHFPPTTKRPPPGQQVLFTISPTAATTSLPSRRNILTTRLTHGRTSFSTSGPTTTTTDAPEAKSSEDSNNKSTNARYNPYGHFGRHSEEEEEEDAVSESSTKAPEIDVTIHSDETQLKKMLLEEIPPHKDVDSRTGNTYQRRSSKERTSFLPATTEIPEEEPTDTLARIIKNLAPKWGRPKNESTTMPPPTFTTPTNRSYNVTMTSRDRSKSRESNEYNSAAINSRENTSTHRQRFGRPTSTTTKAYAYVTPEKPFTTVAPLENESSEPGEVEPTPFLDFGMKKGPKRGNGGNPIEIIASPDLNRDKYTSKETENNHQRYGNRQPNGREDGEDQFIDVLVSADDHKTLVTKETADGIVTSAILPPWYDGNGNNENISDVMKMNGTTKSNVAAKTLNDSHSHSEEADKEEKEPVSSTSTSTEGEFPKSEFDLLLNLFSQPSKKGQNVSTVSKKPQHVNKIATIVTIKPKVMQTDESAANRRNTATRKTPNFKDLMKDLLPGLSSTDSSTTKPPGVSKQINKANTAFHVGSTDGSTDIYGYYPDEDDEDKYVEQHHVESQKLDDDDLSDDEDPIEESPSHVIDVTYDPNTRPEIIIDDDIPYDDDSKPDQFSAGSSLHQEIVPPPTVEIAATGGGIRKPLSSEEEMEFGESDPKPSVVVVVAPNKSSNAEVVSTSEAPQLALPPSQQTVGDSETEEDDKVEGGASIAESESNNKQNQIKDEEVEEEEESEEISNPILNTKPIVKNETISSEEDRENVGYKEDRHIFPSKSSEEKLKKSEEFRPSPTDESVTPDPRRKQVSPGTQDPRANILRLRKPVPKLEEKIRHPSIESVETFRESPVDSFKAPSNGNNKVNKVFNNNNNNGIRDAYNNRNRVNNAPLSSPPPPRASSGEGNQPQHPPGASYEEYESDELAPATLSEELKDQAENVKEPTESNEVFEENNANKNLNRRPNAAASATNPKEADEEVQYDNSYQSGEPEEKITTTPANRVHRVYSSAYDPPTTPASPVFKSTTTTPRPDSKKLEPNKGFIAPTPENFHSNQYSFSPQVPDSVYQSKDGWRPVVYDRSGNAVGNVPPTSGFHNRLIHTHASPTPSTTTTTSFTTPSTQPPSPTFYSSAPLYSTLTGSPSVPPLENVSPTPAAQSSEQDEYEDVEEDEDYVDTNQQDRWQHTNTIGTNSPKKLPIKPSQPIPSPPTPQVKFPEKGKREELGLQSTDSTPTQVTFPNGMTAVDRSKYLVRPAPPPIVMRRTPHANLPYLPPRPVRTHQAPLTNKPHPPPFAHTQQQQHNHGHLDYSPHPTHHPMNSNIPGRPGPARFKHLSGGRPRGNIQWPSDEERRKLYAANRRTG